MFDHCRGFGEKNAAKKKPLRKLYVFLACIVSLPLSLCGQSSGEQFWVEYMLNYSLASTCNLENAVTYSTVLQSPRWQALDYAPTLEYSLDNHFDFSFGVTLSYTNQTEDYNTFEVRPVLGSRIHITPNRRVLDRKSVV